MIDALNTILKKTGVTVHKASLNVPATVPPEINDTAAVYAAVTKFFNEAPSSCTGWLCFTDSVKIIPEEFRLDTGTFGIILSGELSRGNESLHIRQSDNGWQLYPLTRVEDGEMLMVEETFLSTRENGRTLCYENYWRKETNEEQHEVYRPFASRFAGFVPKDINDHADHCTL